MDECFSTRESISIEMVDRQHTTALVRAQLQQCQTAEIDVELLGYYFLKQSGHSHRSQVSRAPVGAMLDYIDS